MECATQVEREIAFYGPENVGTMLGETMIGTGGVIPPPPEYWPMVNEICKANDVLVINDEVITGFGRSGTWFGFEQFGSDPDLITLAKGLSSGYLPLGAVGAKDHVFDAFLGGPGEAFMSGATYMGHPLCCAAGIANLEIVEREKLVERCAELGPYLQDGLATLLAHPIVGDVRGVGLVAGIEYVKDKQTREWFAPAQGVAAKIRDEAFKRGVFVRLLGGGHVHAVAPPFIISKDQIDTVVRVLDESIGVVEKDLGLTADGPGGRGRGVRPRRPSGADEGTEHGQAKSGCGGLRRHRPASGRRSGAAGRHGAGRRGRRRPDPSNTLSQA